MPDETDQTDQAETDLRALLRAHDPARSLTPATPAEVDRILEEAMDPRHDAHPDLSEHQTPDGYATREAGARHRSPFTWLVAAAALVVVGGVAFAGIRLGADDSDAPQADAAPSATADTDAGTTPGTAGGDEVTSLSLPATGSARCMVPSVEVLAAQEVALAGTVTAIDGDTATLAADDWFRGEVTPTVEVTSPNPDLVRLLLAPEFEVGGTYLVSATDGKVTLCGFSGEDTPRLRGLYERAFGEQ